MPRQTAEKIIKEANGPYHILVGEVYSVKKPVKMSRPSAEFGKVTKRKTPKKKASVSKIPKVVAYAPKTQQWTSIEDPTDEEISALFGY